MRVQRSNLNPAYQTETAEINATSHRLETGLALLLQVEVRIHFLRKPDLQAYNVARMGHVVVLEICYVLRTTVTRLIIKAQEARRCSSVYIEIAVKREGTSQRVEQIHGWIV